MKEPKLVSQNPIILRCHRVMEAFAKSDDEKDFYLDKIEGFLIYVDLDKSQEELDALFKEIHAHRSRYVLVPKLTFYEVKKVMEQFANEKVYDIDTKEKLLDIIQSREARENFLEFIYDHHAELEKWQQFYQERFRIRIIEWLRNHSFDFVFEEDIELTKSLVENVKINMFSPRASKDVMQARKILTSKAATYYSSEALNPRPKRGRPPKQVIKVETEPQFSQDIYVAVPKSVKPFLFTPDYNSSTMIFTFSGKFASEEELLAHRKQQLQTNLDLSTLSQKLAALKTLSSNWQKGQSESQSFSEALLVQGGEESIPEPVLSSQNEDLIHNKKVSDTKQFFKKERFPKALLPTKSKELPKAQSKPVQAKAEPAAKAKSESMKGKAQSTKAKSESMKGKAQSTKAKSESMKGKTQPTKAKSESMKVKLKAPKVKVTTKASVPVKAKRKSKKK